MNTAQTLSNELIHAPQQGMPLWEGDTKDLTGPSALAEAERPQLSMVNNFPAVGNANQLCLHQLFEWHAERTPGHPALAFEGRSLTYGELNRRANLLAARLRELGAGPEARVGLLVERSLEMVVGILGILKAGSAYVPIDPATPPERIAFLLADAGISLVAAHSHLLPALPSGAIHALALDQFDWLASEAQPLSPAGLHPGSLAYVIYTSGSTGTPKGVCIEHRNIVNYVLGVAERLGLEPGMKHATVSTVAADLGNTVLFPALATGGCLHVISQARAESQSTLADYFERERIDVLKIVPSHLAALQTGRNPERVLPRRRLILGGEASRLDWIESLRAMAPQCEIFNHYGPTETTVGVLTYHAGQQLPRTQSGTLPLGKPLPNSRVYVVDENGQPAPAGVVGELWIGGEGVARGYLGRPELTAEKFIPDPFIPSQGARLYRTGDRVRLLSSGDIEFLGRFDHQVKIHGYRVELGEVENTLRTLPGVRDAAVIAFEDRSGEKQLAAYIVPRLLDQPLWANKAAYPLPDGTSVAHLNKNETDYIYNEIFGLQAYLRHGITIEDGACIVDAGANIGLFTVFASRLARNLRIFSFEPNPAAFACLTANAVAWGESVKCFPFGLSRQNGQAEMTVFEGLSLLSGFHADAAVEREVVQTYAANLQPETGQDGQFADDLSELLDGRFRSHRQIAQLRTLSSVIAQEGIERIDLLKINVEKCELEILQGIEAGDWPKIRQLAIEVDRQEDLPSILALLAQHGFEAHVEQDPLLKNTDLCYVYALRHRAEDGGRTRQPEGSHVRPVPEPGDRALTPAGIRKQLRDRLPQYMVPTQWTLLKSLPLTANGKIDRKALPVPTPESTPAAQDSAQPRTAAEKKLAAIWTDLLRVEAPGLHDDFFDLGGHSLLAIRAVARIRDEFGVDLPLAALLEAPTIAELAKMLGNQGETAAPTWSSLVALRPTGSRPPFFLMHSHGGNTLEYHPLANLLGPEQPVYALQARGLDGHIPLSATVKEMAAAYIGELRTVQPEGPYFLGGYCLGGLLALEAAQQLTAAGQKVALVVLIQAMNPPTMRFKPDLPLWLRWWYKFTDRLSLEEEYLAYRGPAFLLERIRFHRERAHVKAAIALGRVKRSDSSDLSHMPMHFILEALERVHYQAMHKYTPHPYSGDVVVFRAARLPRGWIAGSDLGWSEVLTGNVEFYDIPGHQQNLLHAPNVALLAGELTSCLATARQYHAAAYSLPAAG